jgi:hypothetical protein
MPHRRLAVLSVGALLALLPGVAGAAPLHVGAEITVAQPTPIADILADPGAHLGKPVRVEGEVRAVCTRMGCWMDLGDEAGHRIRVKVEDGVLVFPPEAAGRPAVAQGTVTVEELSREKYIAWQQHLASEGGEPFDEEAVGSGPFRLVQISGSGADIGESPRPE